MCTPSQRPTEWIGSPRAGSSWARVALTVACAGSVALAAAPPAASAVAPGPRKVALDVSRAPGAEACPDRDALAALVTARLGRDPFDDDAADHVRVGLRRAGAAFAARITLSGPDGFSGRRSLRAAGPACDELAQTVALTLAVAIDPLAALRPPPPPAPIGARRPADAAPERAPLARLAPEPPPPPRPAAPLSWELLAGVTAAHALAPGATVGPTVGVGLATDDLTITLEAFAQLLGRGAVPGGDLAGPVYGGALVACGRAGVFDLCGLAVVGAQALRADEDAALTPVFAPGARVGLRLNLGPLSLVPRASVLAPVTRARARVGGEAVWTTPPVAVVFDLVATWRIP